MESGGSAHNHGPSGHSHDHDHEDDAGHSLRDSVDISQVWCINEEVRHSCRLVMKAHEDRFNPLPSLLSPKVDHEDDDDDEEEGLELLFHVPFSEAVSVKTISIQGPHRDNQGRNTAKPRTVKFFVDWENLDIETARDSKPDMKLDLLPPEHDYDEGEIATVDYPVRPAGKFQNISGITMYFCDNYGGGGDEPCQTEISFIGFKGKSTTFKRRAVECVYESRGMRKDHKVPDGELGGKSLI